MGAQFLNVSPASTRWDLVLQKGSVGHARAAYTDQRNAMLSVP